VPLLSIAQARIGLLAEGDESGEQLQRLHGELSAS